jgi:hypothetical protein
MYFAPETSLESIVGWISKQYRAVSTSAPHGLDVELKAHKRQRSNEQNRFLMAIMVAMVRFYHETGFIPKGLSPWAMRTDILKEYWKYRAGVVATHKLSTADFGKFVDFIQQTLVQETEGQWEVLEPDSAYLKSLVEQGGIE